MKTYIDTTTGEILTEKQIKSNKKFHEVSHYVGVDTKFPSDCTSKESLLEALSTLDAHLNNKPKINLFALLSATNDGLLTNKESTVLTYLCENITGWNYYIGRTSDLSDMVSNSKNLTTLIKSLENKKAIKITHKGFFYKDSVVIKVNPFYVWKGGKELEDEQIRLWYM